MLTVYLLDSVYARTESTINRYTKHIHNTLSGFCGCAYGRLGSYVCNFPSFIQSACFSKCAADVRYQGLVWSPEMRVTEVVRNCSIKWKSNESIGISYLAYILRPLEQGLCNSCVGINEAWDWGAGKIGG